MILMDYDTLAFTDLLHKYISENDESLFFERFVQLF